MYYAGKVIRYWHVRSTAADIKTNKLKQLIKSHALMHFIIVNDLCLHCIIESPGWWQIMIQSNVTFAWN